jgi:putative endonuclease
MSLLSERSHSTGKQGEALAVQYLRDRAFRILETNYRCLYGEIDIVAQKNQQLHFVEVKTRKSSNFGSPVEAYTYKKQQKVLRAIWNYLDEHYPENTYRPRFQIDLVAILLDSDNSIKDLQYFDNAYI